MKNTQLKVIDTIDHDFHRKVLENSSGDIFIRDENGYAIDFDYFKYGVAASNILHKMQKSETAINTVVESIKTISTIEDNIKEIEDCYRLKGEETDENVKKS